VAFRLLPPATMVGLKKSQRDVLIDKVPDAANLAAGALVFGQSLGEQRFSLVLALIGVSVWVILMACTIAIAKEGDA
jgi:hypothetical protein